MAASRTGCAAIRAAEREWEEGDRGRGRGGRKDKKPITGAARERGVEGVPKSTFNVAGVCVRVFARVPASAVIR